MKTGIIVAMDVEAKYVIDNLNLKKIDNNVFDIYSSNDTFLIISGIGLLASCAAATYLTSVLGCEMLYNFGVCGATGTKFSHCEILSVTQVYKRDFNLTAFGYKMYEMPKIGEYISLTEDSNFTLAECYSSDEFVTKNTIIPQNVIVEMEAFSVAYVAKLFNIPCKIYKVVTDITDGDENQNEYAVNLEKASKKIADYICELI